MDKRNTILLTVIAVATLLVAVVGATFAYFTAQMGPGTNTNITVTTSTQDTLSYGSFKALYLVANETNFAQDQGTQKATAGGTISLQANSNNPDEFKAVDYCYTATIDVALNQFIYAPEGTEGANGTNSPELVLAISKNGTEITEITGLNYKSDIGSKKVCDQTNSIVSPTCQESEEVKGFDITQYGNINIDESANKQIKIPNTSEVQEDKKEIHHITASSAGAITEDNWSATIYFVNYDWNQQYNTHKMFTATWNFQTVNCESGEPIKNN